MIWPSGLKHGTITSTVLSSISLFSGRVTSSHASSGAIWVPPTSVAWMLMVMATAVLPSDTALSISSTGTPLGWLSLQLISLISSRRPMFSSEVMKATMNGFPSVLLPSSVTLTIGDLFSSMKYSTTRSQRTSFLSAPIT